MTRTKLKITYEKKSKEKSFSEVDWKSLRKWCIMSCCLKYSMHVFSIVPAVNANVLQRLSWSDTSQVNKNAIMFNNGLRVSYQA